MREFRLHCFTKWLGRYTVKLQIEAQRYETTSRPHSGTRSRLFNTTMCSHASTEKNRRAGLFGSHPRSSLHCLIAPRRSRVLELIAEGVEMKIKDARGLLTARQGIEGRATVRRASRMPMAKKKNGGTAGIHIPKEMTTVRWSRKEGKRHTFQSSVYARQRKPCISNLEDDIRFLKHDWQNSRELGHVSRIP